MPDTLYVTRSPIPLKKKFWKNENSPNDNDALTGIQTGKSLIATSGLHFAIASENDSMPNDNGELTGIQMGKSLIATSGLHFAIASENDSMEFKWNHIRNPMNKPKPKTGALASG
ncbi:hypothetical protein CEXT_269811 [Caerostris extrusa]|uniref:Uncharacterized protein n=1 Tax=Caerostris extrusa TaxID=172846 RepID=A0AAV4PJ56_CAEEX|nr:hypothetical protein CEXT_269811 [Caerostris extrusa]